MGFTEPQAQGFAEILEDTLSELRADLATKDFVRQEIGEFRAEMRQGMSELEHRLVTQMKDLELRTAERLRAQTTWFFAMQLALVSAAFALLKLLS